MGWDVLYMCVIVLNGSTCMLLCNKVYLFVMIILCVCMYVCVCVCVCIVITRTDIAESSINHSIDLYYDLVRLQWKFYSTDMD